MTRLSPRSDAVIAHLAAAGGERIEPPTLLPARLMIELSGEAVRARLCAFMDEAGVEWCLRPDMTSPIADLVAQGEVAPGRRHYAGSVYRLPHAGSREVIEFHQAGFEWFGGSGAEEDAEAAALTFEAASKGGATDAHVGFGDVAMFVAVLKALSFSPGWRERLRRAFSRKQGIEMALKAGAEADGAPGGALAESIAKLPDGLASRMIEDVFAIAGVRSVGGRSAQEIVERLKARREEGPLDPEAASGLLAYLSLTSPAAKATDTIRAFARRVGVPESSLPLEAFQTRVDRLDADAPPHWASAEFRAGSGRRFEYYDGFVFELVRRDAPDMPIASGGRYDGLVARLSKGQRTVSAIGASVRLDRLVPTEAAS